MKEKTVSKIREFNRCYMPIFELLGNRYLGSDYSAAEARVLFEIYENDGCQAAEIAKKMNLDKGYLSRIIKAHEKEGYVKRTVSETDARAYCLHLTQQGIEKTEELIGKSNQQIGTVIRSLDDHTCARLTEALDFVLDTLQNCI